MALVNVTNVEVLNNPCSFAEDIKLQVTFECVAPGIKEELEWKLVYVGSAEDEKHDQQLDSVLVGPVSIGVNTFVFQAPAPDLKKIPEKDLMDVTVMLLTCHYKEKEFIRVGYYVNNFVNDELKQKLFNEAEGTWSQIPPVEALQRNILANNPRVTRFQIPWDDETTSQFPPQNENEVVMDEDSNSMMDMGC